MRSDLLPIRSITINNADLSELRRDAWSRAFKPAKLALDDASFNGKFGLRGGHTRGYPKKSFEVRLDNGSTYHWNAEYDDPSMIRNALSFAFFNQIGVPAPLTNHFWLVINGVQEGVYLEIEAVDDRFFQKRSILHRSLMYAVNDNADFSLTEQETNRKKNSLLDGYEPMKEEEDTKQRLVSFIRKVNGLTGKELASYLERRLDIDQYLLWLAGAVLTGNYDGFDQNYALYELKQSRKYRIIPWDYEGTWGRNCYGKRCGSDLVRLQGYNALTGKLFEFKAWRKRYRDIMQQLLDNEFVDDKLHPLIMGMHRRIDPYMRNDYTRQKSYDMFLSEPSFIMNYIADRREILKKQIAVF